MTTYTIGDKGTELHLLIKQGSTFGPKRIRFKNPDGSPINLTSCSFRAQMRKTYNDATVSASFVFTIDNPTGGEFLMELPFEQTTTLTCGATEDAPESKYDWDMEMVDSSGRINPVFYGIASVFREVTRPV